MYVLSGLAGFGPKELFVFPSEISMFLYKMAPPRVEQSIAVQWFPIRGLCYDMYKILHNSFQIIRILLRYTVFLY
jgi:hypothetical protein